MNSKREVMMVVYQKLRDKLLKDTRKSLVEISAFSQSGFLLGKREDGEILKLYVYCSYIM